MRIMKIEIQKKMVENEIKQYDIWKYSDYD